MAEIQRGVGSKFGIVATVAVVSDAAAGNQTGSGLGKAYIVDYSFNNEGETIIAKSGADGIPVRRIDHGHVHTATFQLEFYDTTVALANAAFKVPSKGSTIVITDSSDAQIAGDWIVESSSKSVAVDQIGKATLTCWRDVAAALSPASAIIAAS